MQRGNKSPVICVGIVCFRRFPHGDEVLLIKRGKAPRKGQWSIPGGRIEPGETEVEACARELMEETAITADILDKIEIIETDFGNGPYILHDYLARWTSGDPVAGDDAAHAEFVRLARISELGMWSETTRIIKKAHDIFSDNHHFNNTET